MDYKNLKIAVFGGSKPAPGDPAYKDAYELGKMLGEHQFTVLTGGYMGTMEAVSRGAVEGGGTTVGITCDEIEKWRPTSPNQWIQREIRCATLMERISKLMLSSQAILVLPGGVGTLAELSIIWNHLLIDAISPRPVILVGTGWEEVLMNFLKKFDAYISTKQYDLLTFAPDIQGAVNALETWLDREHPNITR